MRLEDGLRKHGFKRWYSRELGRAHLQLLILVLSSVGVFAAVELVARPSPTPTRLGNLLLLLVCLALGLRSLRRYFAIFMRAEAIAGQAVCPGCRTYGRLRLQTAAASNGEVSVVCVKCARPWQICDFEVGV